MTALATARRLSSAASGTVSRRRPVATALGNPGRLVAVALAAALAAAPAACSRRDPGGTAEPGPAAAGSPSPGSARQAPVPPGKDGFGAGPGRDGAPPGGPPPAAGGPVTSWVYQLHGYPDGRLDALEKAPHRLAVIDLARDAKTDFFRADEIGALRRSGKRVLSYFEIGSIEEFRAEYDQLRTGAPDLILNRWDDWPNEHFVRYWDERWWDRVVRPRLDQALKAGFDGVYLDTPLAYEELDLALVPGQTRAGLARSMVDLIERISRYAKQRRPGFWIVPQNSPELRHQSGYTAAIDGIGMEELFYLATDTSCDESFCAENLDEVRELRKAGKFVLAVDYASDAANVRAACGRYDTERFAGYVTVRDLDRIEPPCR